MAKKISCADVVSGCNWSATAKDEKALLEKIANHAKNEHNMTSIPDEVLSKVKSVIKDA